MKLNLKHLFALLLSIQFGLLISCGPKIECEKGDKTGHYYLPQKYVDSFPYNGSETLIFLSNHSDTAIFIGKGRKMGHELTESYNIASADCPRMKNTYTDIVNYSYKCQNKSLFDYLTLNCLTAYQWLPITCVLDLDISRKVYSKSSYDILIELPIADSILYKGNYLAGAFMKNSDVLFNRNFGIIRFKELNGTEWTLINKN